jgi:CubicO group peptidase (beta-lactamase class C family)
VVGHNVSEEGVEVARPWPLPRSAYPAGGITCDVRDLLSYARFHLGDAMTGDEARLLSPEAIGRMQSPQVTVWGGEAWGLSWAIDEIGGVRQISHGGGTNGQITLLALIPERYFAIAVLTNANRGSFVTREVSHWAFKEYLGLEITEPMPIEVSEEDLIPYVGRYSRPFADVELGMLGGRLVGQIKHKGGFPTKDTPPPPDPPPMSVVPCEKDRLLVLDGPNQDSTADVIRKPDGSIGWLRASGRVHVREV